MTTRISNDLMIEPALLKIYLSIAIQQLKRYSIYIQCMIGQHQNFYIIKFMNNDLFFLLFSLLIFCIYTFFKRKKRRKGKLVILDGTSCAEKSLLCKELWPTLEKDWHLFSLDQYMEDLFSEQKQNPLPPKEFTEKYHEQIAKMWQAIALVLEKGEHVVCEIALAGICGLEDFHHTLEQLNHYQLRPLLFLAYCPLPLLITRNKWHHESTARYATGSFDVLLFQFRTIYKLKKKRKEKTIDKLIYEEIKPCMAKKDPYYLDLLNTEYFISSEKIIELTPAWNYDYVINIAQHTPKDSAFLLKQHLQKYQKPRSFYKNLRMLKHP